LLIAAFDGLRDLSKQFSKPLFALSLCQSVLTCTKPVIASAVSDQPLILEQADCGLLVPAEDPRALAEAIAQLREMPEGWRLEMGRNARRFAECHPSLDSLAEALLAIYGSAAGHAGMQAG
jgi:glycosyltransferase involved in cell wall biosynthesis